MSPFPDKTLAGVIKRQWYSPDSSEKMFFESFEELKNYFENDSVRKNIKLLESEKEMFFKGYEFYGVKKDDFNEMIAYKCLDCEKIRLGPPIIQNKFSDCQSRLSEPVIVGYKMSCHSCLALFKSKTTIYID